MDLGEHLRTGGTALGRWFLAQTYDSLAVAALWWLGLRLIGVPWAPLWALLGGLLQYIPQFGPPFALVGPAVTAAISGGLERLAYVLGLYAVVVVSEGLLLQPYFMKRTAKVPIWASLLAPVVLGLLFSFWGVVMAAPVLAVVYAYRAKGKPVAKPMR